MSLRPSYARSIVLLCLVVAGVIAADAPPPGGSQPVLRLDLDDIARIRTRFAATPFATIWAAAEMEPLRDALAQRLGKFDASSGLDLAALVGDLAAARLEIGVVSPAEGATGPATGMVRVDLSLPNRLPELWQRLATLANGSADATKLQLDGDTRAVRSDGWLRLADGAQGDAAIAAAPAAVADEDAWGTIDLSALARTAPRPETAVALNALGLTTLEITFRLNADGYASDLRLPGFRAPYGTLDPTALAVIPKDALVVGAAGIDGKTLLAAIDRVAAVLPALAEAMTQVEDLASQHGLPSARDALAAWRGTAWYAMTAAPPFGALTISLPSGKGFDDFIEFVGAMTGIDCDAARQRAVAIPLPPGARLPVQPLLRRTADRWLLSTDPLLIERIAGGEKGGFDPAPALRLAPAGATVHAITHQDGKALLTTLAGLLPLATMAMPTEQRPLIQAIAVAANAAAQHLPPSDGVLIGSGGDTILRGKNLLLGPPQLAIIAGLALPAVAKVHQQAQRAQVGRNLNQLATAMISYAMDFNKMPASLQELCDAEKIAKSLLEKPGAQHVPQPHYCYVRPQSDPPADQPLIVENPACERGEGSMAVYGDGHTRFVRGTALWEAACRLAAHPKTAKEGADQAAWQREMGSAH